MKHWQGIIAELVKKTLESYGIIYLSSICEPVSIKTVKMSWRCMFEVDIKYRK